MGIFLTIMTSLPSILCLLIFPVKRLLFYALLNASLAAFMFGFHMHEKTVLIPLYAALLCYPFLSDIVLDFSIACAFANYHLLK